MGCTLIGARFGAPGLEWVSVGDSPLFLVRDGEIALLNEDHSLAPEIDKLAAAGKITWAEARSNPRRHYLRSAVTGDELDMIDRSRRPLPLEAGDVVIVASDGIQTLETRDIERIVSAAAGEGADAIADALLAAVADADDPYQDNTTIIAVRRLG
jgi:protein phosphatase